MQNKINNCLEIISKKHFFIDDDIKNNPAYLKDTNGQFEVINNTNKDINFLKIDDCIYTSKDNTRCDCAIFDEKVFCFVELKTCKRTAWKPHREKSQKQLENTINNFKKNAIIKDKKLEAYISYTCTINKEYHKIKKASNSFEIETYFKDELNTDLYCNNKKEFN